MVKITKVTTKIGDKGQTQLAAGIYIPKTSLRIEAIGCIDELNAHLGFAAVSFSEHATFNTIKIKILRIQNELFDLGAQLSVLAKDRRNDTPKIKNKNIKLLEKEINGLNAILPTLKSFILPGGNESSARLHIARTVCRRAERSVIRLAEQEKLDGEEIPYLNRLSDWLFVVSRFIVFQANEKEVLWRPTSS